MKRVILFFLVIQSCFFYGQQGSERPKPPKFSASNRVGIIYYEAEEVAQNTKVKEDSDQFYEVAKAIRKYNGKVKEVAFLNSSNFKKLDERINTALQRDNLQDVDSEVQERERKEIESLRNVIPEARNKVLAYQIELSKTFKAVLKEKQYKKWLKYQKRQMKTLLPEQPKSNNNANNNSALNRGSGSSLNNNRGLGRSRF